MSRSSQRRRSKPSPPPQPSVDGGQKGRRVQARNKRSGLWVAVAIVLVAVGGVILLLSRGGTASNIEGVKTFGGLARNHTQQVVTYAQNPPAGGAHSPNWQNCGVYDQPIQKETAMHSLEHGAVWITYRPDLPSDAVAQLRNLVGGRSYTLLSPYKGLPSSVVASAWSVQLQVDSASDPRLAQFVNRYANGSQAPEPGASCTGGVGNPVAR
ncbi:MAG: DUF3105 domain-containing protein [Chloroflexi bacterium]|nr:DUF3105 domain-containing protein [Chloroflexota bacterium]